MFLSRFPELWRRRWEGYVLEEVWIGKGRDYGDETWGHVLGLDSTRGNKREVAERVRYADYSVFGKPT